jgi:hypothetical protein
MTQIATTARVKAVKNGCALRQFPETGKIPFEGMANM